MVVEWESLERICFELTDLWKLRSLARTRYLLCGDLAKQGRENTRSLDLCEAEVYKILIRISSSLLHNTRP